MVLKEVWKIFYNYRILVFKFIILSMIILSLTYTSFTKDLDSRIIVGADYNYPPYEFLDKDGNPTGFNIDLIKEIAKEINLKIEITAKPWHKIRKDLENRKIDMLSGMFYSEEKG